VSHVSLAVTHSKRSRPRRDATLPEELRGRLYRWFMDLSISHLLDLPPAHSLPTILPTDPWALFEGWFQDAAKSKQQPNPNAMVVATIDEQGLPSARVVLCRGMRADLGYIVFYTNYEGAKGRQLTKLPQASAVFHWDHADRQVRIAGPVTRSPESESDAYYSGRPLASRLSAWASQQSEPLASRDDLKQRLEAVAKRFGVTAEDVRRADIGTKDANDRASAMKVPRPPHWGGFRIWARSVELWLGGTGRFHDRARWERDLKPGGEGYVGGAWRASRIQP
jgi:pyridoxamine 5'-phosphate oxidase